MEYEIGDDPQGLPDAPEGNRDGGLGESRIFFRNKASAKRANYQVDERVEDTAVDQMGETA